MGTAIKHHLRSAAPCTWWPCCSSHKDAPIRSSQLRRGRSVHLEFSSSIATQLPSYIRVPSWSKNRTVYQSESLARSWLFLAVRAGEHNFSTHHHHHHPVSDRFKLSFVIFDIRALWRSALSLNFSLSNLSKSDVECLCMAARCPVYRLSSIYCILFTARWQIGTEQICFPKSNFPFLQNHQFRPEFCSNFEFSSKGVNLTSYNVSTK